MLTAAANYVQVCSPDAERLLQTKRSCLLCVLREPVNQNFLTTELDLEGYLHAPAVLGRPVSFADDLPPAVGRGHTLLGPCGRECGTDIPDKSRVGVGYVLVVSRDFCVQRFQFRRGAAALLEVSNLVMQRGLPLRIQ